MVKAVGVCAHKDWTHMHQPGPHRTEVSLHLHITGIKAVRFKVEQNQLVKECRRKRQAWWEQISRIDPRRLVFLDESGVTTEMTRRYGRGLRGERVHDATPAGR
jgi:hypothetical protein